MIQRQKLQIRLFYALLEHILVALEGLQKNNLHLCRVRFRPGVRDPLAQMPS